MDNEVKPSYKISTRIWWNITWKTVLFGIPFSFVGGLIGAMVGLVATGGNDPLANQIGSIASGLAVVPIAIWVIGSSLNETYGKYRVSLTEVKESSKDLTDNEATVS
ncbi:hypothetical protein [Lacimicrobium alkaliphilum]|uniref:MotA/TolQ/ExbB proton channel domain-containing protein n=1 Tax=Lacimicrobium alkaliphilum TaxID=1526571 RepID=A0ABQ1RCP8_9ALTE|nr:hypothetical protein [Lacimicrobium alkaliphilum]GGD62761.1 hypothetical protein GCM10011357_17570 [Lacimicrobium alkaliphilum]